MEISTGSQHLVLLPVYWSTDGDSPDRLAAISPRAVYSCRFRCSVYLVVDYRTHRKGRRISRTSSVDL